MKSDKQIAIEFITGILKQFKPGDSRLDIIRVVTYLLNQIDCGYTGAKYAEDFIIGRCKVKVDFNNGTQINITGVNVDK